jgi:hypothetical protein
MINSTNDLGGERLGFMSRFYLDIPLKEQKEP